MGLPLVGLPLGGYAPDSDTCSHGHGPGDSLRESGSRWHRDGAARGQSAAAAYLNARLPVAEWTLGKSDLVLDKSHCPNSRGGKSPGWESGLATSCRMLPHWQSTRGSACRAMPRVSQKVNPQYHNAAAD